jgi:predicted PurR-regulated permease PerM
LNPNPRIQPGLMLALAVVALSGWIVHDFIEAVITAAVTAVASWPLYAAYRARLPRWIVPGVGAGLFTCAITVLVLAPLVIAGIALVGEARALLDGITAADARGWPLPEWLGSLPVVGSWAAAHWQAQVARPGSLLTLAQQADPEALLGWAQSFGRFTLQHALGVAFAILLLHFFYLEGDALARGLGRGLRRLAGDAVDRYLSVATRAVRASANSMLVVGLFDAVATAAAFALAGVPHVLTWAGITGALAAVPFLGYVAVAALTVRLALADLAGPALLSLLFGSAVLLVGDKVVRPMAARGGLRLPFVWMLIGCVGGFGVLGLPGLVIGPVALTLAWELWLQRSDPPPPASPNSVRSPNAG